MSESLITEDDFFKTFYHKGSYRVPSQGWPSKTIVLYRIRIKYIRVMTDMDKLHLEMGLASLQCERWVKLENSYHHAERLLVNKINQLLKKKNFNDVIQISIDLVMNNSPCSDCAASIIALKERIERSRNEYGTATFCDLSIKFSNFYGSYEPKNIKGLIELSKNQIQLMVFSGLCDWKDFLDHIVKLPIDIQSERFLDTFKERHFREQVDITFVECIKKAALIWVTTVDQVLEKLKMISSVADALESLQLIRMHEQKKHEDIQEQFGGLYN